MNFNQSKNYIEELNLRGSILSLDNIKALMDALGNPQDKLKFVHVAGTNGKGSVCKYISEMLIKSGYKTGIYTSPVVFEYLEKIRIGHRNISQKAFAECASFIKEVAKSNNINVTAFEFETALAFLYFEKSNCDIVVLETGLGGKTDATNIEKTSVLSVITSISMDHYGVIGKRLCEIAEVKAGIIKNGVPVVYAPANSEVEDVIVKQAHLLNSNAIKTLGNEAALYKIGMQGEYQKINASVAVVAAQELNKAGFIIKDDVVKKVLSTALLDGRFEIIKKKPLFIIDGAHNLDAAISLRQTLINKYSDKKKLFIIGVFADKDYESIVKNTVDLAENVVTVQTQGSARALPSYELAKTVAKYNKNVSAADSIEEALEIVNLLKPEMVVAFGSLSYLGYLKKLIKDKGNGR